MFPRHYVPRLALAASISLLLAGCGTNWPGTVQTGPAISPTASAVAAAPPNPRLSDPLDTEATLWTFLGLTERESKLSTGPQVGSTVSPILWQATQDTLHFAGFSSEDPMTGLLVTNWYSPPGKPNERLRVSAFILARALRSDSLSITVDRQERATSGQWKDTPVARDVVSGLESAILLRARQIHAEPYRNTM